MAQNVRDVMTPNPVVLDVDTPIVDAAKRMQERDIGDVIVRNDRGVCGIVTDRDIVVRVLAEQRDPATTPLGEICSAELHTLAPDDSVDHAVALMRDTAVRRLPVVDGNEAVGMVSIGDLAVERDRESALADISAAPPNH